MHPHPMIGRGLTFGSGALACLLFAGGAAAQTLTLNDGASGGDQSMNFSFSGPVVSPPKIVANSGGAGVTVAVSTSGGVTLTNGVFVPGGGTTGVATYNTATFTAKCAQDSQHKCKATFSVSVASAAGGTTGASFSRFVVTPGTCMTCSMSAPSGTSPVTFGITGAQNGGWTAQFSIALTAQLPTTNSASGNISDKYQVSLTGTGN